MKLIVFLLPLLIIGCSTPPAIVRPMPAPMPAPVPVKPVCPKGFKSDWCRPLAVGEMGTTVLGNQNED